MNIRIAAASLMTLVFAAACERSPRTNVISPNAKSRAPSAPPKIIANNLSLREIHSSPAFYQEARGALTVGDELYFYGLQRKASAAPLEPFIEMLNLKTGVLRHFAVPKPMGDRGSRVVVAMEKLSPTEILIFCVENASANGPEHMFGGDLVVFRMHPQSQDIGAPVAILKQTEKDFTPSRAQPLTPLPTAQVPLRFLLQQRSGLYLLTLDPETLQPTRRQLIARTSTDTLLMRSIAASHTGESEDYLLRFPFDPDGVVDPQLKSQLMPARDLQINDANATPTDERHYSPQLLEVRLDAADNFYAAHVSKQVSGRIEESSRPTSSPALWLQGKSHTALNVGNDLFSNWLWPTVGWALLEPPAIMDYLTVDDGEESMNGVWATGTFGFEQSSTGSIGKPGDLFVAHVKDGQFDRYATVSTTRNDLGDLLVRTESGALLLFARVDGPITHDSPEDSGATFKIYRVE